VPGAGPFARRSPRFDWAGTLAPVNASSSSRALRSQRPPSLTALGNRSCWGTPAQGAGRRPVALGCFLERQPLRRLKLGTDEFGRTGCDLFDKLGRDGDAEFVAHSPSLT
jgi:hypothetical protein